MYVRVRARVHCVRTCVCVSVCATHAVSLLCTDVHTSHGVCVCVCVCVCVHYSDWYAMLAQSSQVSTAGEP